MKTKGFTYARRVRRTDSPIQLQRAAEILAVMSRFGLEYLAVADTFESVGLLKNR